MSLRLNLQRRYYLVGLCHLYGLMMQTCSTSWSRCGGIGWVHWGGRCLFLCLLVLCSMLEQLLRTATKHGYSRNSYLRIPVNISYWSSARSISRSGKHWISISPAVNQRRHSLMIRNKVIKNVPCSFIKYLDVYEALLFYEIWCLI